MTMRLGVVYIRRLAPRERLELPTCGLGNRCSVLLSYRGVAALVIGGGQGVNCAPRVE